MHEKRRSVLRDQYESFINAWNLKNKFWFSYIFDLIFYLLVIISFIFWGFLLKKKAESLTGIDYNAVFTGSVKQMEASLDLLQSFFIYLGVSLAVLILVIILLFTVFKGVIWTSLMDKKRNPKYFRNLFFVNLLFYIPFIALLIFFLMNNLRIYAGIVFLLVLHFNAFSIYFLSSGNGFWKSLRDAFVTGVRVHKFWLFYVLFGILFFVMDLGFGWIRQNFSTNLSAGATILIILTLYLSIVRNGFIKLIDKIK